MGTAALAKPGPDEEVRDEYYYGYRMIVGQDERGGPCLSYRPLTPDDLLEPDEGDVYMQGNLHERDVDRLRSIFRHHLRDRRNMTVYSDMKMEWGVAGLPNPAPDISVIADVRDPDRPRRTFSVAEEGVRPLLVLEVVSPRYRAADTDRKPDIYSTGEPGSPSTSSLIRVSEGTGSLHRPGLPAHREQICEDRP